MMRAKKGIAMVLALLFVLALPSLALADEEKLSIDYEGELVAGNMVGLTASLEGEPVAAEWQLACGREPIAVIRGNGTLEAKLELLAPGQFTLSAKTQDGAASSRYSYQIKSAYTLTLPDGTGIEADNSGWAMVPAGQDRVFLEVYPASEVKDAARDRLLTPVSDQNTKYEARFNETQVYGASLEAIDKAFFNYYWADRRAKERGKDGFAERLAYQTGAYSRLYLAAGTEEEQGLILCWQLELPELETLSVEGAAFYTPFDLKASIQKFIFNKGEDSASFRFTASDDLAKVFLLNAEGEVLDGRIEKRGDGYSFDVSVKELTEGELTLRLALENRLGQRRLIELMGYGRLLDTPDRVEDYLCLGSQYSDGGNRLTGVYGLYPEKTLIGNAAWYTPVSLGNYGGYITYYYEEPIKDDPKNPYGVDFIVYGNSNGGAGFSEPGNVLVSKDGNAWYALAGSEHYEDMTKWAWPVTYTRTEKGYTLANGGSLEPYMYPSLENYPLHSWQTGEEQSVTVSGTKLAFGQTATGTYPAFGYVDVHTNSYASWGTGEVKEVAVAAKNPYWPISGQETGLERPADLNGIYEGAGDCFDLAWAVDEQGMPVRLEEIHYVKVQTAALTMTVGGIGEKSTEVNAVVRARSGETAAGKSAPPTKISIGGQEIPLRDGVFEYTLPQPIAGPFGVEVEASPEANVYINNLRALEREFSFVPAKGLIRVIIQEGEKEPLIYLLRARGAALTEDEVTALWKKTLDKSGQSLETATLVSRGQAVDLLYTLAGEPEFKMDNYSPARQLDQNAWYTPAVAWAVEEGLLAGDGSGLAPEKPISGEQLAAIFQRYARILGREDQAAKDALFDGDCSDWAKEAARWAIESGIFEAPEARGFAGRTELDGPTLLQAVARFLEAMNSTLS